MNQRPGVERFVPLATMGAVTYSVLIPTVELWRYALRSGDTGHVMVGVLATVSYLPLHVRHVRYAARGSRPPRAGWTVAAMAVVIIGVLPFLGALWLGQFHALAVSVLIVMHPPWSFALFAGIVAAQTPLAFALHNPDLAPFFTIACAFKGLPVFLLIWLVGAIRRLQAARLTLADEAVTRERLRIDSDLWRTVGTALDSVAVRGERAIALSERDPPAARDELHTLVEAARRTLTEVRRLIRGYQHTSLRAELDTATTLLSAAGIETTLRLPDDLPDTAEETERSALRAGIARLLRDDTVRRCVITVTSHGGRVRLEVRAGDDGGPATKATTP